MTPKRERRVDSAVFLASTGTDECQSTGFVPGWMISEVFAVRKTLQSVRISNDCLGKLARV
jgi:hypothetical protein